MQNNFQAIKQQAATAGAMDPMAQLQLQSVLDDVGAILQQAATAGTMSQNADARTITRIAGGNNGSFADMASGTALDDKIRSVQNEAEVGGWSPELKAEVNGLRAQQTDNAVDARHMKQQSKGGGGGGGGSYAGGGYSLGGNVANLGGGKGGNDLLGLAQALAQYKAQLNFNQSSEGNASYNRLAQLEQREAIGHLQPIFDSMMAQMQGGGGGGGGGGVARGGVQKAEELWGWNSRDNREKREATLWNEERHEQKKRLEYADGFEKRMNDLVNYFLGRLG